MDDSLESTIEKIKVHEQGKELQLREKRTIEATLASVKRQVQETILRVGKLKEELLEANARADALDAEVTKEQAHQWALAAQLESSEKELQHLKFEADQRISNVWERRNLLCNEVQKVSDQCDVWALFTKPKYTEKSITSKKTLNEKTKEKIQDEEILERIQKKRQSLLVERERLLSEPETGEEFKRIKNALRYSVEMATQKMKE